MTDYEIVIVDDGSTRPDTLRCIETFDLMCRAGRLGRPGRVLRMDKNLGQSWARNKAVLSCKSEYIAFLDADDAYMESSLITRSRRIHVGKLDMVWSAFIYRSIEAERGILATSNVRYDLTCASSTRSYEKDEAFEILQQRNITTPLTVMVRRSTFIKAGGFETSLVCGEDHLLWRRIMEMPESRVEFFDEPTGWYQTWLNVGPGHQSKTLHSPPGGFHLNVNHPTGKSGEYLDDGAKARAAEWIAMEKANAEKA
jgi:glycosyltransferase involved in cell wall biosynthesis